jgi:hypothetical protein
VGFNNLVAGCPDEWKQHLITGRLAEDVWTFVSEYEDGSTCGW